MILHFVLMAFAGYCFGIGFVTVTVPNYVWELESFHRHREVTYNMKNNIHFQNNKVKN